ncbi:21724_t:CDS:2 [Dentiscutata erythropus]|uniref:21724_t:CDS:1 n=1 Tax=Dentiscutata erythropus TaxID=1348616 RepID=A0A9N9A9F8_9GLOM|nr:21724_t:CDS:2 [Dentiscutata erythropus]
MGQSTSKFFGKKNDKNVAVKGNTYKDDRKNDQIEFDKEPPTLTFSVIDAHRFIEGRRFRIATNVTYTFPSDCKEATRFNESMKLMKRLFDSSYSTPVEKLLINGAKVLEIGTSGGFWLTDMSKQYPMSTFLGLDTSTIFNPECLPENCAFLEYNYFDEIPFPENHSISSSKFRGNLFDTHLIEITRVVKPGGWIEIFGTPSEIVNAGPATKTFVESMLKCFHFNGLNPNLVRTFPRKLKSLNIKNIKVVEVPFYLSPNHPISKNKGQELLLATAESLRVMIKLTVGYTDEEYDVLIKNIIKETETLNMYTVCVRTFGQKSLDIT